MGEPVVVERLAGHLRHVQGELMLRFAGERQLVGEVEVLPGALTGREDRVAAQEHRGEVRREKRHDARDRPRPAQRRRRVPADPPVPAKPGRDRERHDHRQRPQPEHPALVEHGRERPGRQLQREADGQAHREVVDQRVGDAPQRPVDQGSGEQEREDDVRGVAQEVDRRGVGRDQDGDEVRERGGQRQPAHPAPGRGGPRSGPFAGRRGRAVVGSGGHRGFRPSRRALPSLNAGTTTDRTGSRCPSRATSHLVVCRPYQPSGRRATCRSRRRV